jgi:hypothetical protein
MEKKRKWENKGQEAGETVGEEEGSRKSFMHYFK